MRPGERPAGGTVRPTARRAGSTGGRARGQWSVWLGEVPARGRASRGHGAARGRARGHGHVAGGCTGERAGVGAAHGAEAGAGWRGHGAGWL